MSEEQTPPSYDTGNPFDDYDAWQSAADEAPPNYDVPDGDYDAWSSAAGDDSPSDEPKADASKLIETRKEKEKDNLAVVQKEPTHDADYFHIKVNDETVGVYENWQTASDSKNAVNDLGAWQVLTKEGEDVDCPKLSIRDGDSEVKLPVLSKEAIKHWNGDVVADENNQVGLRTHDDQVVVVGGYPDKRAAGFAQGALESSYLQAKALSKEAGKGSEAATEPRDIDSPEANEDKSPEQEIAPKKSGNLIEAEGLELPTTKTIPSEIEGRFIKVEDDNGSKFYRKDDKQKKHLIFEDSGNKLEAQNDEESTAEAMVKIAKARGWSTLKVQGSKSFKQEVWKEAMRQGIDVKGYRPSKEEKKALVLETVIAKYVSESQLSERHQKQMMKEVKKQIADEVEAGKKMPEIKVKEKIKIRINRKQRERELEM